VSPPIPPDIHDATDGSAPPGWKPLARSSRFLDLVGPLWVHPEGPRFGLRTGERHLNNRGAVHGGVLSPIADTMLGYALTYGSDEPVVLTTAQLSIDLLAGIGPGEWLEGEPGPGRLGRHLAFGYGQFTVADTVVAVVRAVFSVRAVAPDQRPPRPW
jgi:acyl-coenzyme A thioesterase PaaI-like protein